ncbi:hypothetical protein [Paenibacillus eucommiae]|uniref:Uncharacterized protein n=1 Tax=Paenibacillus eucommiae TaxID=1355755 RepID=A0ABS4J028_9BACL|nr:hypothetical protein [Paenibacillus eucommiae]MBP1993192.1 hypothetical protein [Paenibacillus eucommiae]
MVRQFTHRAAYGVWINDMRNSPLPYEEWPSVRLDEITEKDIIACIQLMSQSGYNEFVLWGLFATYSWSLDLVSSVDEERAKRIERIIQAAKDSGVRILTGIGIYSWGFDSIIEHCPGVRGTNPHAMCASSDESWEWVKKIMDFVLTRFNFDGLHLESADQGRCNCPSCDVLGDIEYHCIINARAAQYLRSKNNNNLVMVSLCGYMPYDQKIASDEIKHFIELSKHIDYLIDGGHYGHFFEESTRSRVVAELHCDYGTSGGIWIYPPQRWDRLRWFLPYTQRTAAHIKELYEDGGRAIEYYMGPDLNPGVEVNIAFGGKLLADVDRDPDDILNEIVTELYQPDDRDARDELAALFKQAETAYFDNWYDTPEMPKREIRQLHITSLFGTEPGAPTYLAHSPELQWTFMDAPGREIYRREIINIQTRLLGIEARIGDRERLGRINTCLNSILADIAFVNGNTQKV